MIETKALQAKKTVALARWLLGKHLVRRFPDGREEARMIVETEAYDGERDLACHARAGRTKRTEVMYAAGGIWYVYLCYGVHELLNLVVGPRDWPAAILIRGVEGAIGLGRVTKALGVDRRLNATSAADETNDLWLEDRGVRVPHRRMQAKPRVGVEYAGPIWSMKRWRFTFELPGRPQPHGQRPRLKSSPKSARAAALAPSAPGAPTSPDRSGRKAKSPGPRTPRRGD